MFNSIPAATIERFATFGDFLRFLRRRAGLTQIELSIAVGYSDAQISRLEQNLRLPDIATIESRFVPALGLEDEPKIVTRLLELAANLRREDAPGLGISPYKGLNAFDETDADLFVGREALTARLVERVLALAAGSQDGSERFLAIVGASGSGKSSLARAGLVPALRWNKISAGWPLHVFTPTARPLDSLATTLTQEAGSVAATAKLVDDLRGEPRGLSLYARRLVPTQAARFLLVVDQFEELFTLCRSEPDREALIDNLLVAAGEPGSPAIVVITLRADFYAHCAGYPQLRSALARQQEYIGAMSPEELRRAIEEPARRGRWELEDGLVDLLLHDVGATPGLMPEPGALPLLSHALLETWQRRRGRMLTLNGYAASGGVRGAIAETAEAVFADQFSPAQQAIARRIFLSLTELGDETATGDTRRRATFDELILRPEEAAETRGVLKALADARLITTSQDSAEVAHEALIREWPKLRGWLEDNREGLRLHRHLTEAARDWAAQNRETDSLHRGVRLVQAQAWAADHGDELNTLEREFLDASLALAQSEAAERDLQRQRELEAAQKLAEAEGQRAADQASYARQLRQRAVYLAGAFVLALIMAIVALSFGAQARQAAADAQSQQRISYSRELAAAAISNLDADPERSILLALQSITVTYSVNKTWTAESEDALRRALQGSRLERALRGHSGRVFGVAFSPDGRGVAAAADDGTLRVWDLAANAANGKAQLVLDSGDTHGFSAVAFSPDGARLVTGGAVGTARMWDATTGQELATFSGHTDWVTGVAFSPDGKRLATASEDRTVIVYDTATGQQQRTLIGHTGEIYGVAFSPDGRQIATASSDGTARVWDATTGNKLFSLAHESQVVISVGYSPDGARLATASEDRTAKVWDAATGELILTLRGHTSAVTGVRFSPDGARLATSGVDGKAIVWDAATGQQLFTLSGHTDRVASLAFSPAGDRLATSSFDRTVKIWNVSYSRELFTFPVLGASNETISPDGRRLAAGFTDGRVKIFDISRVFAAGNPSQSEVQELLSWRGHDRIVNGLAFSPDGTRLATTSEDQTVKLWDAATGNMQLALRNLAPAAHPVAFSPDGARLATAGASFAVNIWDLKSGKSLVDIDLAGSITSLAFTPDGSRLVGAITDGTVRVWNAATGDLVMSLRGHSEGIYALAISPDGAHLATASDDATAKVWDTNTGQEVLTLTGHTGWVNSVAFSPDGDSLATSGQDGTVRLWDAATGQPGLILPGFNDPVTRVAFSPDGGRLITASLGVYRFYLLRVEDLLALAKARVTRSFTPAECRQFLHLSEDQCQPAQAIPTQVSSTPEASQIASNARQVCELTDARGLKDDFYNQIAYQGVLQAAEKFGWHSAVLEPHQLSEYLEFLNTFLNSGCDLIVVPTGGLYDQQIHSVAVDHPEQKFLAMEIVFDPPLANVWDQYYATDQAAFLAGYVAASVTKTGKVATFGGYNFPPVAAFMNGFALGVEYYNQKNGAQVETLGWEVSSQTGLFTGGFNNTGDGRRMAEQLLSQGADVILPVAGVSGLGAAAAIQERGDAYLIGVDSDWAVTYPEYAGILLTSITKRLDASVVSAVQAVVEGTFSGGPHYGTLENGGVGLAPFHNLESLVSPEVRADLQQIQQGIIDGKIKTQP